MEYRSTNNRWITDTPNYVYSKFIGIVAGLPDDATKWSLTLYTTYFSALIVSLQDKIEDDNFDTSSHFSLLKNHYSSKPFVWPVTLLSNYISL